ncbi:MAG TPA: circadian clock KaiB family protein [Leptospiraceae bacterium]|nr:circadian clock KaiB family protein [Leptospiraceae bacterium]HMY33823.1 circadian clock KaiB family protein [Leptospiraceae bacterium]HMZ65934.1 circadian clock KaiB family protein [Leptospiraceae bacterium]HNA08844.1 circadian clock KaiB family protein [Leptospiraceae bacterium]HNC01449.1 circadian clock KaiB family protein [Leptospiraceae bacterium]
MAEISVKIFVTTKDLASDIIQAWKEELNLLKNLSFTFEIIDFDSNPQQIEKYDILFSPTTLITLPEGKNVRFIGYNKNILVYLRAYSLKIQSEIDKTMASSHLDQSLEMKIGIAKMRKFMNPKV